MYGCGGLCGCCGASIYRALHDYWFLAYRAQGRAFGGGGWWYMDLETDILYLYGKSESYKSVTEQNIIDADCWRPSLEGYSIYFSESESLDEVLKNSKFIKKID